MGIFKLGDHGLTNPYSTSYLKHLVQEEDRASGFLSPQLCAALKYKLCDPVHNVFKSDVWAVGATLLECCTLLPSI